MVETKPGGIVNHPCLVLLGICATCVILVALFEKRRYGCNLSQSATARVKSDIVTLHAVLDAFAAHHDGIYPESLDLLVAPDTKGRRYLNCERVPRDPWNRAYIYMRGDQLVVMTLGADGKPGGTGDDADIDYASLVNGR